TYAPADGKASSTPLAATVDVPWDANNPFVKSGTTSFVGTSQGFDDARQQTNVSHRIVFLQRLADPTRPWDRMTNPYLSVDRMPVDLTIHNSEPFETFTDPKITPPYTINQYLFGSRQRGKLEVTPLGTKTNNAMQAKLNIWSSNPCKRPAAPAAAGPIMI